MKNNLDKRIKGQYKRSDLQTQQLRPLTGRVVISRDRFAVTVVAMVSKQGLVVVVFIPVEGLNFEAASLGVSADDT